MGEGLRVRVVVMVREEVARGEGRGDWVRVPPPGRVGEGQGEGDSVEYGVPEVMFKDPVGEGLRLPLVDRVVVRHTDIENVTDTVGVGCMVVARGLGDRVPLTVGLV